MKVNIMKITEGEEEIIIRCRELTPRLRKLIDYLNEEPKTVIGKAEEKQYRLRPEDIYYFESVDERLFAYTGSREYQVMLTLSEAEERFGGDGFFRCNKSFVANINKIDSVQSEMGNRIDATLDNGEHIIISRRYARAFREMLKGGAEDEEKDE